MKTIQNVKTLQIMRVDNKTAADKTATGLYRYIPKYVWKKQVRDKITK